MSIEQAMPNACSSKTKEMKDDQTLMNALEKIKNWKLPTTGKFWDKKEKEPMSYEACFGSDGVRDYFKSLATKALKDYTSSIKEGLKEKYKQWCKETKRNGGVLVGGSMYEFFKWLDESSAPESGGEEKELWEEVINDINTLNKEGSWDKMYFSDMMKKLKKKFRIVRKDFVPNKSTSSTSNSIEEEIVAKQDEIIGRLKRENEHLQSVEQSHQEWLSKAKKDAGFDGFESFDDVWKKVLAAYQTNPDNPLSKKKESDE